MKTGLTPARRRLLKTGGLTAFWAVAAFIGLQAALSLHDRVTLLTGSQTNAALLAERLSRPAAANLHTGYQVFLAPPPPDDYGTQFQNEVITLVSSRAGQIIDIRSQPDLLLPEQVRALRHQIVFEGDLQTVTDVISGLEDTGRPILVDRLSIRPAAGGTQADRALRATLDVSLWTEVQP